MTRWARANNVHKHKAAEATPWSQLRARGGPKGGGGGEPQKNRARGTQPSGSAAKKPNNKKKKKDYTDQDVNGFLEFLQRSGQAPADGREELRQEVHVALRKDQRRENRRLKRQTDKKSKMLCFNCRKPGHGLADCPEAERDHEMGRGICYRCGSAEHEIQRCRAKVDPAVGDFPYAKCFICGQTGHLSRSCPDNPKGLYAQGGSCHVCGSVEHFQKDCPEHQVSIHVGLFARRFLDKIPERPRAPIPQIVVHTSRKCALTSRRKRRATVPGRRSRLRSGSARPHLLVSLDDDDDEDHIWPAACRLRPLRAAKQSPT